MHCEHSDCDEPATAIIEWPEIGSLVLCALHLEAAKGLSIAQDVDMKVTPVDE